MLHTQRSSSSEKDDSFVRNSSFLRKNSPPKNNSPPIRSTTSSFRIKRAESHDENSVVARASKIEAACSPPNVTLPPVTASIKINRSNSKEGPPKVPKRENSLIKDKDAPKVEQTKETLQAEQNKETSKADQNKETPKANQNKEAPKVNQSKEAPKVNQSKEPSKSEQPAIEKQTSTEKKSNPVEMKKTNSIEAPPKAVDVGDKSPQPEESNGVGDKIKKFEKAAEDAGGKLSRPGSVRGRSRTERLGSDSTEDFPPPATPFKDNVHFDLPPTEKENTHAERPQHGIMKNNSAPKWQRSESHEGKVIQKPEPQKIIKPEFKPMPPPADVTIRSPSLGTKLSDQFPSHGTAFRNVASPAHKFNEDVNTQNNVKACSKFKPKDPKSFVSKGSSYFTRGSEEIWLVKKKDIEEIEERVLDSFRRAGGNICMRSESMRPASEGGQAFTHATMGRKRAGYARSESCEPAPAWGRAHTLKRQTSVACTCGHDKRDKARAQSVGPDAPPAPPATPRPRSRSHGDDNSAHVLDKYETLV